MGFVGPNTPQTSFNRAHHGPAHRVEMLAPSSRLTCPAPSMLASVAASAFSSSVVAGISGCTFARFRSGMLVKVQKLQLLRVLAQAQPRPQLPRDGTSQFRASPCVSFGSAGPPTFRSQRVSPRTANVRKEVRCEEGDRAD